MMNPCDNSLSWDTTLCSSCRKVLENAVLECAYQLAEDYFTIISTEWWHDFSGMRACALLGCRLCHAVNMGLEKPTPDEYGTMLNDLNCSPLWVQMAGRIPNTYEMDFEYLPKTHVGSNIDTSPLGSPWGLVAARISLKSITGTSEVIKPTVPAKAYRALDRYSFHTSP